METLKLLPIDKDGTLVETVSGETFINKPWDQKPIDKTREAIGKYAADGWTIVIISNQAGVAAGHKSLESAIAEMQFCLELFPEIKEAYFCPDFEGIECYRVWGDCDEQHRIRYENEIVLIPSGADARTIDSYTDGASPLKNFRKPHPGMLNLAIDVHAPSEVLYVGDRPEDEAAAKAANIPFQWAEEWR